MFCRGFMSWDKQRRLREQREQQARSGGRPVHETTHNKRFTKLNKARWQSGRRFRRGGWNNQKQRSASVKVQADWEVLEQYDLANLTKLVYCKDASKKGAIVEPTPQDVVWAGSLQAYDEKFEKVTVKTAKKLQRVEDKEFFYVTTTEDPFIQKLAGKGAANVFITDAILAHLMASPRSVYPWDIVVIKVQDKIFFDKRDNSRFDYVTVSETATEPPDFEKPETDINHPNMLSVEATAINQNFSQQILTATQSKKYDHANPFFDEDEDDGTTPAAVAYRYRRWALTDDIMLLARCELHGTCKKRGEECLMTAYAMNQWNPKQSGGTEWRGKLDSQRGAVLATELNNNSAKLAKWTAQSYLAGADQMKLGFVSRSSPTNRYTHEIMGTASFKPKDLAQQITLNMNNIWGIILTFVELLKKQEDGKFVIARDPNKPLVRVYKVPMHTFEEDDEDESDDDEE